MRIQDALKSKKPFRTPFIVGKWLNDLTELARLGTGKPISKALGDFATSLLSEDWEVLICEKHNEVEDDAEYLASNPTCHLCEPVPEKSETELKIAAALLPYYTKALQRDLYPPSSEPPKLEYLTWSKALFPDAVSLCTCGAEKVGSSGHSDWCDSQSPRGLGGERNGKGENK